MERTLNRDEQLFLNLVRTGLSNDLKAGTNGALIPNTIAERVIERVIELSPIYARATKFNIGGDLKFVVEDSIPEAIYIDEMQEGEATDLKFKTIELNSFIARSLTKVSRSLLNRAGFDLLTYLVNAIAKSIVRFIEKELIVGTVDKIEGLSKINPITVPEINADSLIDLQIAVPSSLQGSCEWIMNPKDVKAIRKLKTTNGLYLFQLDITSEFGYKLLGNNLLISDQVPEGTVYYGDFSGLYAKLANDIEISVLKERYAEQYSVAIVGFVELDAKVVETQKIAAIKREA